MVGSAGPGVAGLAEHHVAVVEVQPGPLQLVGWRGTGGVHVLVQLHGARVHVEPDQVVLDVAVHQLVGHREELLACRVDDGCAGDAHRRRDVATGQVGRGHGRADVGRPEDGAGVGRQGIERVVLRGDVDAPGGLERLAVELPVEGRRGPGRVGRRERDTRGVDPAPQRVAVVHGPARGRPVVGGTLRGAVVVGAGRPGRRRRQRGHRGHHPGEQQSGSGPPGHRREPSSQTPGEPVPRPVRASTLCAPDHHAPIDRRTVSAVAMARQTRLSAAGASGAGVPGPRPGRGDVPTGSWCGARPGLLQRPDWTMAAAHV